MLQIQEVSTRLREHGFKVTPQRLAVYQALAKAQNHPRAETIYTELRPSYPTMSLATVYKSLAILCEAGLAQELNLGEDAFRYDADTSDHPHVRCMECGRVEDVEAVDTEALTRRVSETTGYELTDHQLYFYGICPACRKKKHRLH